MDSEFTKHDIGTFTSSVKNFFDLKPSGQIDVFVYYLTIERQLSVANVQNISQCFLYSDITPYSNISQYLAQNLKSKSRQLPKFIKLKEGYQLHRSLRITIDNFIEKKPLKAKVNKDLHELLPQITNPDENEFLKEAINCFEISAYRASIVMVWNLTLDHLFAYIIKYKLVEFNSKLALNTDKRIKIKAVVSRDDFNEIPENKFIEFCRNSGIISNDIRKILDIKLGIRNTYAHPSNLKIGEAKAIDFIEDLVNNVILKFKL